MTARRKNTGAVLERFTIGVVAAGVAALVACSSSGSGSPDGGVASGGSGSGSGAGGGDAGDDSAEAGGQGSGSASSGGGSGSSGGGATASAVSCPPGHDAVKTSGFAPDVDATPTLSEIMLSPGNMHYNANISAGGKQGFLGVGFANGGTDNPIPTGDYPVGAAMGVVQITDQVGGVQACYGLDGTVHYTHDASGTSMSWAGRCNKSPNSPASAAVCFFRAGM
jgi:hypothetical protein